MSGIVTGWLLAILALVGAASVVFSRDALRLVLGLGTFLLAVAGFFLYYGAGFLATAQMFVYVGGVLVLVLFVLMLLARDVSGRLLAPQRFDPVAAVVAVSLAGLLAYGTWDMVTMRAADGTADLGKILTGSMLPAFELLGVLLLAALVATLVIVTGGEDR